MADYRMPETGGRVTLDRHTVFDFAHGIKSWLQHHWRHPREALLVILTAALALCLGWY